ncbi:MAG: alpha-L-fucosidase [Candidatus Omnitrophica bacterium]|nr:alpha-L-fucosidase [Candidatus Omnitrophota bacterium]
MKRITVFMFALLTCCFIGHAQPYEANWESLDQRSVADWFEDAKFGIFIHWGPYSVPAWTPKGTYSEWYQYWMQSETLFGNGNFKGTEVADFHRKTYGHHFPYYKFGEMFTADQFEPERWAELFKKSGAKYIVLTSKHHDGFCLWPSKEANDRGFPWNSADVGAHRDLLGDLTQAVKAVDIKMGFYYSLYEWYHPWWQNDKERFVQEHFLPQVKDLVERYQPDILWGDGEWDMTPEQWRSQEMLAWLFNESSVKDAVVINDRWGKGVRHHHGGYYTTEYDAAAEYDKPWEECRGMGFSFGYNQNEDIEDYNSAQVLLYMLIDIVAHGGNLLLDIGPDGRGNIPVIMQERLLQMGHWLEANGEAIYQTRPWFTKVQWTEGDRNYKPPKQSYLGGDYILAMTVNPKPGYAAKEVFFTSKGDALFAITPKWPMDELSLKGVQASEKTEITLLADSQNVSFRQEGENLVLTMPPFDPNVLKNELTYAYVFKISHVKGSE